MSYRKKQTPQYDLTDRRSWTAAFQKVSARCRSLENQGWTVERGSLTKSQADRATKELDSMGYETKRIPIGILDGETVEFVAYKPKPQPAKSVEELEGNNPLQRFHSLLKTENKTPSVQDHGLLSSIIPSGQYSMTVIMHNANPKTQGISAKKVVDEIIANPEKASLINYAELDSLEKGGIQYVSFNGAPFSVAGLKSALKVLGIQRLSRVHAIYARWSIVVFNPDLDYVIMTRVFPDVFEDHAVNWEDHAVDADYLEDQVLKSQPK